MTHEDPALKNKKALNSRAYGLHGAARRGQDVSYAGLLSCLCWAWARIRDIVTALQRASSR